MSRQQCPSCGKRYEPPGPCPNLDGGEPCGFLEAPRTHAAVPTPARPPIPSDGYSLGATVDPKTALAQVRAELQAAIQRKGAA